MILLPAALACAGWACVVAQAMAAPARAALNDLQDAARWLGVFLWEDVGFKDDALVWGDVWRALMATIDSAGPALQARWAALEVEAQASAEAWHSALAHAGATQAVAAVPPPVWAFGKLPRPGARRPAYIRARRDGWQAPLFECEGDWQTDRARRVHATRRATVLVAPELAQAHARAQWVAQGSAQREPVGGDRAYERPGRDVAAHNDKGGRPRAWADLAARKREI